MCAEKQIISFARLAFCSLKKITASVLRIHWHLGKELRFFSIFLSSSLKGNIARRLMTSYSLAKRRTYVFCTLREVPLRYSPPRQTHPPLRQTPPSTKMATEAGGTHPTGMHSCSGRVLTHIIQIVIQLSKLKKRSSVTCHSAES